MQGQALVAYRVHAPMHAMEASRPNPPTNRAVIQTEREQLAPRDYSVLPVTDRENSKIHRRLVEFLGHLGGETRQAPSSPPLVARRSAARGTTTDG